MMISSSNKFSKSHPELVSGSNPSFKGCAKGIREGRMLRLYKKINNTFFTKIEDKSPFEGACVDLAMGQGCFNGRIKDNHLEIQNYGG